VRARLPRLDRYLAPPPEADQRDWQDPRVGWGLVLPDDDAVPEADRAAALDAPEPIRELQRQRGEAPVLRYRPGDLTSLRRYFPDRPWKPLNIAASEFGVAEDRIPRYLLICGSPGEVPWALQFILNSRYAVGRLDLTGDELASYVGALLSGWADDGPDPLSPVLWSTDHAPHDMSAVMKRTIATPVFDALASDADSGPGTLYIRRESGGATSPALRAALADRRPGLIVTTSHGNTGGVVDARPAAATNLGFPVGEDLQLVDAAALLADWDPYGAIWYAHACASAGSSSETVYAGLFERDSEVDRMFRGVAGLGDVVAPLPRALLGHRRPARAFIGHVEPTFDWTISDPQSGQALAGGLRTALYTRLYAAGKPYPVGVAFGPYFEPIGALALQHDRLHDAFERGDPVEGAALQAVLGLRDRASTVILGDPTVALSLAH
jgi:hypothetical protein